MAPQAGSRGRAIPLEGGVTCFVTCVVDAVAPGVAPAASRVLQRLGLNARPADGATCCGQPAWNSGFVDAAARVALTTLSALEEADGGPVCVLSGSCATMMRLYWPEMFRLVGDEEAAVRAEAMAARVVEFSELVAEFPASQGRLKGRVAYHRSCHMTRELGIVEQPTALLDSLEGCSRVEWADDQCCGFGGTFSVKQPEISVAMADVKIGSLLSSGAERLVGCDQSCLAHLEGRMRRLGVGLPVQHLAVVLDESAGGGCP